MDAYIFKADLYCADCADEIKMSIPPDAWPACIKCGHLASEHGDAACAAMGCSCAGYDAADDIDSDAFPAGPYPDGGGEADTPQHCAECGVALDNPVIGRVNIDPTDAEFAYAGSVSSGTMRSDDVGPALLDALDEISPEGATAWRKEWAAVEEAGFGDGDATDEAIDALFDALNERAPEGWYFGAHPGDGADYGFWRCED